MVGASSTCGGGWTQNVAGAGTLLVVTNAVAYLFPHVSLGHLHYLPKLLYWGLIIYHRSHPFNASSPVSLITSNTGSTTTTVQLWNTSSTTKSVHVPISSQSPVGPAHPGILSSNFCLCRFALSGHFISMDSCRKWPFVSGFYSLSIMLWRLTHVAAGSRSSSLFIHLCYSTVWLQNTLFTTLQLTDF